MSRRGPLKTAPRDDAFASASALVPSSASASSSSSLTKFAVESNVNADPALKGAKGRKRKTDSQLDEGKNRAIHSSVRLNPAAASFSSSSSSSNGSQLLEYARAVKDSHCLVFTESKSSGKSKGKAKGGRSTKSKIADSISASDSTVAATVIQFVTPVETTFLSFLQSSPQADPTVADKHGDTFLHHAMRLRAHSRYPTLFEYSVFPYRVLEALLSRSHEPMLRRIDPYAKNKAGESVLDLLRVLAHDSYGMKRDAVRNKIDMEEHAATFGEQIDADSEQDNAEMRYVLADGLEPADWHCIARRFKQGWQRVQVLETLDEFLPRDLSKMITSYVTLSDEGSAAAASSSMPIAELQSPNVFTFADAVKHSQEGTRLKLFSQVRTWRFPLRQWRADWELDENDENSYPPDTTNYSPEFEIEGRLWNIILHAHGSPYATEQNGVAAFLQLREPRGSEPIRCRMAMQMVHPTKSEKSKWRCSMREDDPFEFSASDPNFGYVDLLTPSQVDEYLYQDGSAVIRVWVDKWFNPPFDDEQHVARMQDSDQEFEDEEADEEHGNSQASEGEEKGDDESDGDESDEEMRCDSSEEDEAAHDLQELAAETNKYGKMDHEKLVRLLGEPTSWRTPAELFEMEEQEAEIIESRAADLFQ